jgi:quinone-modifying oxidoreductase subunit QmoC
MAETLVIQPDAEFIRDLTHSGGSDLKKCYQCATCSVVCTLSSYEAPFPRKQMLQAQWGLKDQVLADPAIWLCHNCGDCSTHCPRGARPGDVFGALRREAIKHCSWPGFLGRWVNNPKMLPLLALIPILLFGALWAWGPEADSMNPGQMEFANQFPVPLLEALFFTISGLVLVSFLVGLSRFVRALRAHGPGAPILPNLLPALGEIATHRRFAQCGTERNRYWGHLLILWGFLGLAAVGTIIGLGHMAGLVHTPLAQTSPLKIFANVSAVAALAGLVILLADRLGDPLKRARSTYFDWFFVAVLAAVVVTGFAAQFLREGQLAAMYAVYFVHLVLIFMLFLYAPYSKLAHFLYRTVAMAAAGPRRTAR